MPYIRTFSCLILILMLVGGCVHSSQEGISVRSKAHLVWPLAQAQHRYRVTWEPDSRVIADLERALSVALGKTGHSLSDYFVRYYGTEEHGRRYVMCSGQHHTMSSGQEYVRLPVSSDLIELEAFGGGSYFFTASYEVARRKVIALGFNAPL
jgi:hypothetical protein